MIYIASPYSHPLPEVREARARAVCEAAMDLFRAGFEVHSPIAACVGIERLANVPGTFDFWQRYNRAMIRICPSFAILTLDGWRESRGVKGEAEFATEIGRQILFVDPADVREGPRPCPACGVGIVGPRAHDCHVCRPARP